MGKQITVTFLFLISLFLFGCGNAKTGGTIPQTDDSDLFTTSGGGGTGSEVLPTVGGVPAEDAAVTGGLPNSGSPAEDNLGGLNAAQGADLNQTGSDFASAYQNLFSQIGSFDPRQVPEQAKPAFNTFMCAMLKANLFRTVAQQMTLPEYVSSLYINILRRAPESQAVIDGHANNILTNGTRAGVRGFILSDEHLQNVIKGAYKHFFGSKRVPTAAEMNKWKPWLKAHQDVPGGNNTLERFYANLIGSSEFYAKVSKSRPRQQVINLYRYVLGRMPAEVEISFWQSARNQGNATIRVSSALEFFQSDEYRLKKIGQMIRVYWAVPVTGDEVAARLQGMKNGRDQFITMTDLLTDPRYYTRVHTIWSPFSAFAQSGQCGN